MKLEPLVSNAVPSGSRGLVSSCFVLLFFSCLEGYKSAQMPRCFQICFCNNLCYSQLCKGVHRCKVCLFTAANAFRVPGVVSPGLFIAHVVWKCCCSEGKCLPRYCKRLSAVVLLLAHTAMVTSWSLGVWP